MCGALLAHRKLSLPWASWLCLPPKPIAHGLSCVVGGLYVIRLGRATEILCCKVKFVSNRKVQQVKCDALLSAKEMVIMRYFFGYVMNTCFVLYFTWLNMEIHFIMRLVTWTEMSVILPFLINKVQGLAELQRARTHQLCCV